MSARAASGQREPPEAPPEPREAIRPPQPIQPEPRARRFPPASRLLRGVLAVLALAVVGGAVALGWVIGTAVAPRKPAPPAPWLTVELGPAALQVPSGWEPDPASLSKLPGLPEPAVAFRTAPGLAAHAVISFAAAGRDPLEETALKRLIGPPGTPRRSQAAGRPAEAYEPRSVQGDRMAELTVVPTSAGTLLVLCIADGASWTAAAGCAGELRRDSLTVAASAAA